MTKPLPTGRRAFLAGAAALLGGTALSRRAFGQEGGTRLILLGTGGGPRPRKARGASAQVIVASGAAYVVDCGNGVAPAVDRLLAGLPNATALKRSILSHHTTAEDAGRLAQAAGVKTLVLSHLVPAEDPAVTDATWADAARTHFRGRVIVGKDLLEI